VRAAHAAYSHTDRVESEPSTQAVTVLFIVFPPVC
jgi:hypothetical protein